MFAASPSFRVVIRPKSGLIGLVQNRDTLLAECLRQTWECDVERRGRSVWSIEDYVTQAKLAVLARVYENSQSDLDVFRELQGHWSDQVDRLFDQWWTLEVVSGDEFITGHLAECDPEAVLALPKSGRPNVDYWLEEQRSKSMLMKSILMSGQTAIAKTSDRTQ